MLKVQRIPVGAYDVTIEMVKPSPQQLCKSSKKFALDQIHPFSPFVSQFGIPKSCPKFL